MCLIKYEHIYICIDDWGFSQNGKGPTFSTHARCPSSVPATGEPPLCMSCVILFALRNALSAARQDAGEPDEWYKMGKSSLCFVTVRTESNQFIHTL